MKHKCPIESNSEQVPEPNLKAYCLHTKLLLYISSKRSYCRSSHDHHHHHHVRCHQSSCEATAEKCIWMFKGWNSPASVQVFKFDRKFSSCPRQVLHHSSLHSQHHHSTIIPPSLHYHSTSPTSSEPPTIYQESANSLIKLEFWAMIKT